MTNTYLSTETPRPSERELSEYLASLDANSRRFMPLQPSDIATSDVLAWSKDVDRIVGVAGCIRRYGLLFLHISVLADTRKAGVGHTLVKRILEAARTRRRSVYLSVHAENKSAIRLYQRVGFVTIAAVHGRMWMVNPTTTAGRALTALLVRAHPLLSLAARVRAGNDRTPRLSV